MWYNSPYTMRKTSYIWELPGWPNLTYDAKRLLAPLGAARKAQGALRGRIESLGFRDRDHAELDARTEEAVQTAQIEGEPVSRVAVRSSIARRLNIAQGGIAPTDATAQGLVDMTLDATMNYDAPLTAERVHYWHTGLFPVIAGGRPPMIICGWRNDATGPMQVVSGRIDRPTLHFEAPPAARIPGEVAEFLAWFESAGDEDGLVRSAIAHLWFLTIHPYDDENGRIARAIADMALARDERSRRRFFSMSREINADKARYYDAIERAQRGNLDLTDWLIWFLESFGRAIQSAQSTAGAALQAQAFWHAHDAIDMSARQRSVLVRYLHEFEGKLTAKKWSALSKISIDAAQRDIADLVEKGVLIKNAGGSKKTSYSLAGHDHATPRRLSIS